MTKRRTADDERKAIIDRQAAESLRRLDSDFTLNDWRNIWAKVQIVTEEVMAELGLVEWDGDNKKLVREITNRMEEWERSVTDRPPMTKSERWGMREFFGNPRYEAWLMTLDGPRRRRLNHPQAILNAFNRATRKLPRSGSRRSNKN